MLFDVFYINKSIRLSFFVDGSEYLTVEMREDSFGHSFRGSVSIVPEHGKIEHHVRRAQSYGFS